MCNFGVISLKGSGVPLLFARPPYDWNADLMAGTGAAILGHKMEAHVEDDRADS